MYYRTTLLKPGFAVYVNFTLQIWYSAPTPFVQGYHTQYLTHKSRSIYVLQLSIHTLLEKKSYLLNLVGNSFHFDVTGGKVPLIYRRNLRPIFVNSKVEHPFFNNDERQITTLLRSNGRLLDGRSTRTLLYHKFPPTQTTVYDRCSTITTVPQTKGYRRVRTYLRLRPKNYTSIIRSSFKDENKQFSARGILCKCNIKPTACNLSGDRCTHIYTIDIIEI